MSRMSPISGFACWAGSQFEDKLCPLPSGSSKMRLASLCHHLQALPYFPLCLIGGALEACSQVIGIACRFFKSKEEGDPQKDFHLIAQDSRRWKEIDELQVTFEPPFSFGTATCTWQDSAQADLKHAQWSSHEARCVDKANQSALRSNLFGLYRTAEGRSLVIDRLQKLGVTAYRFSLEWSHLEPSQGVFNEDNLKVYIALCQALRDAGITPEVTLHHFSEPQWFHDRGGFEKEENIPLFVSFVKKVTPLLVQFYKEKPLVGLIYTINEVNIDGFCRYVIGSFSPGVKIRFGRAGQFLLNALRAHCAAYDALKQAGVNVPVGVVYQRLKMIPTNPLLALVTHYFNRILNDTLLHCAKTGDFVYKIPFCCHIKERVVLGKKTDFVGMQYYARVVAGLRGPTSYHEPMTQMPYREDPEGIYEALLEVHDAFQKPIVISENGIAAHTPEQRGRYLERALYAVYQASQKIGHEQIWGYRLWCPFRTSEWDMGWGRPPELEASLGKLQDFAAYDTDDSGQIAPQPRPGMEPFIAAARRTAQACQIKSCSN